MGLTVEQFDAASAVGMGQAWRAMPSAKSGSTAIRANGEETVHLAAVVLDDGRTVLADVHTRWVEAPGGPYIVAVSRDVTEQSKAREVLENLAFHDPLTGVGEPRPVRGPARARDVVGAPPQRTARRRLPRPRRLQGRQRLLRAPHGRSGAHRDRHSGSRAACAAKTRSPGSAATSSRPSSQGSRPRPTSDSSPRSCWCASKSLSSSARRASTSSPASGSRSSRPDDDARSLLMRADIEMYEAKRNSPTSRRAILRRSRLGGYAHRMSDASDTPARPTRGRPPGLRPGRRPSAAPRTRDRRAAVARRAGDVLLHPRGLGDRCDHRAPPRRRDRLGEPGRLRAPRVLVRGTDVAASRTDGSRPADARSAPRRIETILRSGQLTFDSAVRRKDGALVETEVSSRRVDTALGPVVIAVIRDISELDRVQAHARASRVPRRAHGPGEPRLLRRPARQGDRRRATASATCSAWPISTSTSSSRSTTGSGTTLETPCSSRSAGGSRTPCAPKTPSRASAGTSSSIILPRLSSHDELEVVAERLVERIEEPVRRSGTSRTSRRASGSRSSTRCADDARSLLREVRRRDVRREEGPEHPWLVHYDGMPVPEGRLDK